MYHKFIIKFISVFISIFITTQAIAQTHTLVQGWNLEGNDNGVAIDPNDIFGNAATQTTVSQSVTTVWAWDKTAGIWNFFAPSMTPTALSAYATTKGYGVLTTIQQGQGFWVNAKTAVSVNLAVSSSTPQTLFSKAGTGDTVFDIPKNVSKLNIKASYDGATKNFMVKIGDYSIVNETLGTYWKVSQFEGTYLLKDGRTTEIVNSSGVSWTFTEVK